MLSRIPGTGSMGRGPFRVTKLYKPVFGSVGQPGHGPTRPSDRLGPESICAFGGSANRSIGVPATAGTIIRLAAIVNATTCTHTQPARSVEGGVGRPSDMARA